MHIPPLITDLALILAAAAITTLIFKRLRQPLVLGYIVAGLLVGPHVSLIPTVTDEHNIQTWSEIGVIFLLFSLGLEFSFKKLMKVGGAASITAVIEVVIMLLLGYAAGRLLGWSAMDSIFLGGILSVSSTTIIIRAFDELGVKGQQFAGLVFGILVVEDLVAIVLLVLLSTLAASREFAGMEMLGSIVKLLFFLIVWFVAGIFFLPTLLQRTRKLMNEETLLVTSIGLCLGMVVLATQAGFSPALGAFVMGSILAETTQAEKIEHLVKPVKELFGAVFFVSVGMLIDPAMILRYIGPVVIITVITIVGKLLSTTIGALTAGQPLKPSVQAGMSLAQIGEFSFIIATLGLTLKVTSGFLYPVAVAVSAVTTFTTPYLIRLSEPVYNRIAAMLPHKWKTTLNRYSAATQTIAVVSDWKQLLRSYFINIVLFSVIIIAIVLLLAYYVLPMVNATPEDSNWMRIATALVTLIVLSPFLWALAFRGVSSQESANIWQQKKYRGPLLLLRLLRIIVAVFFIGFSVEQFFSTAVALLVTLGILALLLLFRRRLQDFYSKIEERFFSNFNERETRVGSINKQVLAPWDAHLAVIEIQPVSPAIGKSLQELALRERFGANIVLIRRGDQQYAAPGKDERLYPGDVVTVIGTDEQISRLFRFLEEADGSRADKMMPAHDIVLRRYLIKKEMPLYNKSIREAGIREQTQGMILGIERSGQRILNPESTTILQEGDIIWVAGSDKRLAAFFKKAQD
ncbi:cation:proton antiporter domain-containing protein [Chitinophaga japonensis]|uniref:Transporter, CPA2 family (TC 2.A.37) n=1 Tax=Chitinophaga japonensis TaxID=104662 RepID=A0A562SN19_CHIJA|nr:cation:proton antiporter [Chitinophaga japonensis]TWI82679.1 transporter, CPA2 family (TC 2.A.37) [Chitinophaga japonensis]